MSFKPIGAEVWLDGKQLGSSPDLFRNILVGSHSLLIKKDGCAEHRETITITEGEKKVVAGALSTNLYPDFSGKIPAKGTDAYGYYEKAIIGRGGEKLKKVGKEARLDIEQFFGKSVYLELFVKVEPDWRNRENKLRQFGYTE